MMQNKNFSELLGWQKADQLTVLLYGIVETFPEDERYDLVGQIKCTGSAIAANMAEGWGRGGDAELVRYPQMVMGSASESE